MARRAHPNLTLLALLTTVGVLSAGEGLRPLSRERLAPIQNQQSARAVQITQSLLEGKSSLGLGSLDGLQEFNRITDAFGFTHVRYHQTYRGVEVYNGTVLGHMDAQGRVLAPHTTVQKNVDLPPATLLDEAKIKDIVTRNLSQEGRLWPILVTPVVFPTRYQDGLKFKRDASGHIVLDSFYSVATRPKGDPYRWAFQAHALQATKNGIAATGFVIDGLTGEILRKWNGQQHVAGDTPSAGTGIGQYNGTVPLATQLLGDANVFTLRDTTRATMPWPNLMNYTIFGDWTGIGSQTRCYDPDGPNAQDSGTTPFTSAVDTWGDGGVFVWDTDNPVNNFAPIGQTAAVDADYAVQCSWDYYDRVLGRTGGIDGQGSSVMSLVHECQGDGLAWNNASWNPFFFCLEYGDGAPTGSCTCLDVAAHEISHGVMTYTSNLTPDTFGGESSGLNEANSDIHATMIKYYWWGANGQGNTVPDSTTQAPGGHNTWDYLWTMGPQLSPDGLTPLRYLYKPSKDGYSYDAWFQGLALDDPHFSMGPGNRAFFFLSQGASSDATKETYSAYLPKGMAGIGNDEAIKIWYHAMTTKVTSPGTNYHAMRLAVLEAATDLYPGNGSTDSAELAAVKNAFAAVNVGPAEGAQEPVVVTFPDVNATLFWDAQTLVVPAMVPTVLPAPVVTNTQDTSVTWSLGGLSVEYPVGGTMKDGLFTAPMSNYGNLWPVMATSTADPKEFAVDLVYSASLDCDSDSQTDACDMAALALAYGYSNLFPATNFVPEPYTNDVCVAIFLEGFHNAFTH